MMCTLPTVDRAHHVTMVTLEDSNELYALGDDRPTTSVNRRSRVRSWRLYSMKHILVSLILLAGASFAAAQIAAPATDVLGAHLNYGRGFAAC